MMNADGFTENWTCEECEKELVADYRLGEDLPIRFDDGHPFYHLIAVVCEDCFPRLEKQLADEKDSEK